MKKFFALLLAALMLLSVTACGAAPEAAAPAATESPTAAPTEAPTEAPNEAPTEPLRVAPVDFEPADPTTLPEPISVEEQLLSEDTQTVKLISLEAYEDLLWELGFQEVRLAGTHQGIRYVRNPEMGVTQLVTAESFCKPVSLTYNDKAFRLDFVYCQKQEDDTQSNEEGWCLYGTKASAIGNLSTLTDDAYTSMPITPTTFHQDSPQLPGEEQLKNFNWGEIMTNPSSATEEPGNVSPYYEEQLFMFTPNDDPLRHIYLKEVYYPITGNLYNYICDPNSNGVITPGVNLNPDLSFHSTYDIISVGVSVNKMCFHYLFPEENGAE